MVKKIFGAMLLLVLVFCLTTPAFAQDSPKKETKKMEMKEKGKIHEVACDDACGFRVQSRNDKELTEIVKAHAQKYHKMEMTDAQVKEKMKEVK
jgi:predicted small metal-binding protein